MSILVIGSVAFDAIETPFGKTDKIIGGAATYISLVSSYFVKPVNLVAVVGGDFPKSDIELLQQHGVDTKGLQIKENEKSFFWSGKYHNDMNSRDTLVTELNVLGEFDPIIPDEYQDCDYLMLGNLAPQVQKTVIERLNKRPKLIVMDTMNFWMDTALGELKETLELVDVLCINDEEARQLSGEYSLLKAAREIRSMGPNFVIIKKGEHGALLFGEEDRVFFVPALPLEEVFDPTGAGDCFAGGFIGHIAKVGDTSFATMAEAVVKGSAMASFCVEKFGTEGVIHINQEDIQRRVEAFTNLVRLQ
ncbi:MAG: sugar kinase [Bernardetiaceae bacterium]|nr:sugar kinase [Bernardetiaceae bacterium]